MSRAGRGRIRDWFRFPVWREFFGDEELYEWQIPLQVRNSSGTFTPVLFLLDSGTQLTTIPIHTAERFGIPFARSRPVGVRGTAGTGHGFVTPLGFSLAGLPEYVFECLGCFSPTAPRPLLSLTDVIKHFRMRTLLPSRLHPLGSLLLQLHGRHKGQPRPPVN
jgi:hypothetical protein